MNPNTIRHIAVLIEAREPCERYIPLARDCRARTDNDSAAAELLADRIRSDRTSGMHKVLRLMGVDRADIEEVQDATGEGVDWLLIAELFVLASVARDARERLNPED